MFYSPPPPSQCSESNSNQTSHHGDHAAGAHGVHHGHTGHAAHAHHAAHALEVWVLPPAQEGLVALEVGAVEHHEAAVVHLAGVAAGDVHVDVGAVAAALIGAALEVPVLVEDNLRQRNERNQKSRFITGGKRLYGNSCICICKTVPTLNKHMRRITLPMVMVSLFS